MSVTRHSHDLSRRFSKEKKVHDHQMWVEGDQCGRSIPDDPQIVFTGWLFRWPLWRYWCCSRVVPMNLCAAAIDLQTSVYRPASRHIAISPQGIVVPPGRIRGSYALVAGYLNVAYRSRIIAGRQQCWRRRLADNINGHDSQRVAVVGVSAGGPGGLALCCMCM